MRMKRRAKQRFGSGPCAWGKEVAHENLEHDSYTSSARSKILAFVRSQQKGNTLNNP